MKKLFIYLFAALAVASCEHKDLCYDHSHTIDVEVVFDWRNASEAAPESMSLYLFPTNGGEALRYEFTDCGGGTIRVPVGNYGALCLNSDTENVTYRNTDQKTTFEVSTRTTDLLSGLSALGVRSDGVPRADGTETERVALPPDELWSDCTEGIELKQTAAAQTIVLYPELSVCRYTVEIRNAENLKYVSGISGSLSSLAGGLLPGVGYDAISEECVTIPFDAAVSADKTLVTGSLLAFGHCAATQNAHQLTIYAVLADESKWYYTYDVTDQIHSAPDQRNVCISFWTGFRCPNLSSMAVVSSLRWMSGKVWMSISRCKMLMIFPILWGGNLHRSMLNLLINSLMKKQLFLVVVAALAMASCSKDESTGINNGNAIDFRAAMQTRASETTMANITNFFVTALDKNNANYFSDAEFTKDGAFFTSTPAYYWPSDGSNLSFFAYSPSAADLDATVTINSTTKTLADFEPATTIADQKDFITATATGSKTDEAAGVALTFGHRLSQIEIKAKNTNDGYVYKVQGVRIGQPVSKATFDFGTTSWQLGSVKTNYEATYAGSEKTLTGTAASIMAVEDDNAMLIPQQLIAWTPDTDKTNTNKGAYLAVKVNITTKDGARVYPSVGEYDWVAVAVNTKWEPGQKYVYTLDFSNGAGKVDPEKPMPGPTDPFKPGEDVLGSAIKFTVTVTPWTPASEDVTM